MAEIVISSGDQLSIRLQLELSDLGVRLGRQERPELKVPVSAPDPWWKRGEECPH